LFARTNLWYCGRDVGWQSLYSDRRRVILVADRGRRPRPQWRAASKPCGLTIPPLTGQASGSGGTRSALAATIAAAGNGVPASPQRHRRAAFPSAPHSKLSRRARIYSGRNLFGANKYMVQQQATALPRFAFAARCSRLPSIHSSSLPFFHCSKYRYRRDVPLRAGKR
jgi:hypothetical protein